MDRSGDRLSQHPSQLPGDRPTHPANTGEAKLHFPKCIAAKTCRSDTLRPALNWKLGEVERGRYKASGMWLLAEAVTSHVSGQPPSALPVAVGPAFCSFAICSLSGKAPTHSKSYKCKSGAESCWDFHTEP